MESYYDLLRSKGHAGVQGLDAFQWLEASRCAGPSVREETTGSTWDTLIAALKPTLAGPSQSRLDNIPFKTEMYKI